MQRNTLKGRETCIIPLELATAFWTEIPKKKIPKRFCLLPNHAYNAKYLWAVLKPQVQIRNNSWNGKVHWSRKRIIHLKPLVAGYTSEATTNLTWCDVTSKGFGSFASYEVLCHLWFKLFAVWSSFAKCRKCPLKATNILLRKFRSFYCHNCFRSDRETSFT